MSEQILEQYGRVTFTPKPITRRPFTMSRATFSRTLTGIWQHSLKTIHLKK